MLIEIKLGVTGFVFLIGIAVCFIDMKKERALPDWMWQFGRYDPIYLLLYKRDGSPRKYFKHAILIWFVIFLGVMWLFF